MDFYHTAYLHFRGHERKTWSTQQILQELVDLDIMLYACVPSDRGFENTTLVGIPQITNTKENNDNGIHETSHSNA